MYQFLSVVVLATTLPWWFQYAPANRAGEYTFGPFETQEQCETIRSAVMNVTGATTWVCYVESETEDDE